MSTATSVPVTRDRVGEPARATLRAVGRRRLALDAVDRFRAADGFSHARALAFAFALTLLPSLITIVGLATALDQTTFTRVVRDVLVDLAPSAAGDVVDLRAAPGRRRGAPGERRAGAGARRVRDPRRGIHGVRAARARRQPHLRDRARPAQRAQVRAGGGPAGHRRRRDDAAAVLLIAGSTLGRAAGWGDVYSVLRWPVIVGLVTATLALVFKLSPWRRQPEASWLIIGATFSAVLWLALTGTLAITLGATADLGATYGPITGTIAVLLWTLFSALAILFGLAVAAQLEAVRAGVSGTRVDRHHNGAGASQETEPLS